MLKNALLIIGSLAVALLAFELVLWAQPDLQAAAAGPRFGFCEGPSQRYRQDAVFRKAEIPQSVYFEHNGEQWSLHLNNDRGFRDVFDSGEQHAIILGDSFTRGTSLHDHQTIPYLLDLWTPAIAFHSFAIGGSGTADALRAYQAVGGEWDHRLVVLDYYLGNDLRNNLAGDVDLEGDDADDVQLREVELASGPGRALVRAHRFLRANSRVYNLAYASAKIMTRGRRGRELPSDRFELGADITKGLLLALGREAASHHADLLIVVIPSWNEIMDLGAEDRPDRQRALIGEVADQLDNVHVLDLGEEIRELGARRVYGQVDKHFNAFGAYTTARAIYQWMQRDWPNGPRTTTPAPVFDDDSWGITRPDCGLVEEYRKRLLRPAGNAAAARSSFSRRTPACRSDQHVAGDREVVVGPVRCPCDAGRAGSGRRCAVPIDRVELPDGAAFVGADQRLDRDRGRDPGLEQAQAAHPEERVDQRLRAEGAGAAREVRAYPVACEEPARDGDAVRTTRRSLATIDHVAVSSLMRPPSHSSAVRRLVNAPAPSRQDPKTGRP